MTIQTVNSSELTGSQKLVLLYRYISSAKMFSVAQFAAEHKIKTYLVYHYLKLLRDMGFPIINTAYGQWEFGEPENIDILSFIMGGRKFTRAQNLVMLY